MLWWQWDVLSYYSIYFPLFVYLVKKLVVVEVFERYLLDYVK